MTCFRATGIFLEYAHCAIPVTKSIINYIIVWRIMLEAGVNPLFILSNLPKSAENIFVLLVFQS
jgi:hypothetical protein